MTLQLQQELSADGKEVLLYCHSQAREANETAMVTRFGQRFETGLAKIATGLQRPRGEKRHHQLLARLGRLQEKSRGATSITPSS